MSAAVDPGLQSAKRVENRNSWLRSAADDGFLSITVESPAAEQRHALDEHIDAQIERALVRAGGCARPAYVPSDAGEILADQLYRARMLGFEGLALRLESLETICKDGALDSTDSRTLCWWLERAAHKPLRVYLNPDDRRLKLYTTPVTLEHWTQLEGEAGGASAEPRSSVEAPDHDDVLESMELSDLDFPEEPSPLAKTAPAAPCALRAAMRGLLADIEPLDDELPSAAPPCEPSQSAEAARRGLTAIQASAPIGAPNAATRAPSAPQGAASAAGAAPAQTSAPVQTSAPAQTSDPAQTSAPRQTSASTQTFIGPNRREPSPPRPPEAPLADRLAETRSAHGTEPLAAATPPARTAQPSSERAATATGGASVQASACGASDCANADAAPHDAPVRRSVNQDQAWLWKQALQTAQGTQTWTDIQELFCENYVPLQRAVLQHCAPLGSEQALADWARSFSSSYTQVFEAMRTRGKRPTLVLDAPNVAFRAARRGQASQQRLILVDALRYDIALSVADKLQLQLLGLADCVEQGVLWSALPTTTAVQLELLARGPDGLRQVRGELDEAQLQSQGNDIRRLRAMRVGPHHLYKLDVVSVLAQQHQADYDVDLAERCAAEVAVSVARFVKQQPPGTLVCLFGDHGFGGPAMLPAPPEHVLVPYQAWLTRSQ